MKILAIKLCSMFMFHQYLMTKRLSKIGKEIVTTMKNIHTQSDTSNMYRRNDIL